MIVFSDRYTYRRLYTPTSLIRPLSDDAVHAKDWVLTTGQGLAILLLTLYFCLKRLLVPANDIHGVIVICYQ